MRNRMMSKNVLSIPLKEFPRGKAITSQPPPSRFRLYVLIIVLAIVVAVFQPMSQSPDGTVSDLIASIEQGREGMTLWQVIQSGGVIMLLLGFLSIVMVSLSLYVIVSTRSSKLIPVDDTEDLIKKLSIRQIDLVKGQCQQQPESLTARIAHAGLRKLRHGRRVCRDAMVNEGKRAVSELYQRISYLNDIAMIAPMVGLLGTVVGLIQAFNVIAFHTAGVKPILLAGGVSKAMVTTAAGLIIAIPAMILYAYFRGHVQKIVGLFETYASDIIDVMGRLCQSDASKGRKHYESLSK